MALIPAKIIARLHATYTSDVAELSWEWVMRTDGQVSRRMTAVNRRPIRDLWQVVTQVPARERQMVRINHAHARAMLVEIARQRGHHIAGPSELDRRCWLPGRLTLRPRTAAGTTPTGTLPPGTTPLDGQPRRVPLRPPPPRSSGSASRTR